MFPRRPQRGEPELPVEPWQMRRDPGGTPIERTGLVSELVGAPRRTIVAALEDQFRPGMRHYGEQPVIVERTEWHDHSGQRHERRWKTEPRRDGREGEHAGEHKD